MANPTSQPDITADEMDEGIPVMQQILDNPFLLLFLGIAMPTVLYIVWGVMEIITIAASARSKACSNRRRSNRWRRRSPRTATAASGATIKDRNISTANATSTCPTCSAGFLTPGSFIAAPPA